LVSKLIATEWNTPTIGYLLCPFNYHTPRQLNYISCSQKLSAFSTLQNPNITFLFDLSRTTASAKATTTITEAEHGQQITATPAMPQLLVVAALVSQHQRKM